MTDNTPGLICPECGFKIMITIPMLLENRAVFCSACGLKLTVDMEKSAPALDLIEDLHQKIESAHQEAENARNFGS